MVIYTTLNRIRKEEPCVIGWRRLLAYLNKTEADDEPLAFSTIVQSNGLEDALWCTRSVPEHDRIWRLFAVWCARRVKHTNLDPNSMVAIDIAELYANGKATNDELAAAQKLADDAWELSLGSGFSAVALATSWVAKSDAYEAAFETAEAVFYFAIKYGDPVAERKAQTIKFLEIVK